MNIFAKYSDAGKYNFLVMGERGLIEIELIIPAAANFNFVAIIGHPHPLHGGTMHNKVVTTMAKAYENLHIPSIRFNFRGVGKSEGEYDAGIGESNDMLNIAKLWKDVYLDTKFCFAGFSFGAFVAYKSAFRFNAEFDNVVSLITIAPTVTNYDYHEYESVVFPWLIVQGDADEIIDANLVYAYAKKFPNPLPVLKFSNTSHFFHGKLIELRTKITDYLSELIN